MDATPPEQPAQHSPSTTVTTTSGTEQPPTQTMASKRMSISRVVAAEPTNLTTAPVASAPALLSTEPSSSTGSDGSGATSSSAKTAGASSKKGISRFFKMPLPLFGKTHKTPAEVVKQLRDALIVIDKNNTTEKKTEKALEDISKNLAAIKTVIYGSDATEPHGDQIAQLAQEVYNANILPMLIKHLPKLEFESKKDVAQIFNNLLRRQIGTRSPTVEYLGARPEILSQLVMGYAQPEISLTCGLMLRECIRHDHLAKIVLYSDQFFNFFVFVQSEVFDIASDAFSTFKDAVTKHKTLCAEFLDAHYDKFFGLYQQLLNSKNYVTRRQSLKLLGELLLDRHNFNIMTKYISNPENLKLMMELLRDKSRNIQYEAFHVFKVFVANPNKPRPISDILNRNRDKLVEFLGEFHNDRTDDEQFNDEKAYLIKQIQEMKSSKDHSKEHSKEVSVTAEAKAAAPAADAPIKQ